MAVAREVNEIAAGTGEGRLARETGLARRVASLAEPVLEDLGYRLVRVRISGQGGCTVQVMAERHDGTMTVDDCETVSRALSPVLDVDDPIPGGYLLEVSSPGIDRPLVRPEDFERWAGYEARIEMTEPIDGRRRFRGTLKGFADGEVRLQFEAGAELGQVLIGLPFRDIVEARLVMTDRLIRNSLKRSAGGSKVGNEQTGDKNQP